MQGIDFSSSAFMPDQELQPVPIQAEWYYVGHYGQLGPLTLDQMGDLARDGVIDRDTYIWRVGMSDWVKAVVVQDLFPFLGVQEVTPPVFSGGVSPGGNPPPSPGSSPPFVSPTPGHYQVSGVTPVPFASVTTTTYGFQFGAITAPKSDKSRIAAAILGIIIPGAGRFYLGYAAHGVLQFMLGICGPGVIWSWIDSIYILSGGVKYDGYGRTLE